jgi:isopentenyl-diphosphate delta-isomerase
MLLQQRAFSKYHSGGLWTNTCCSHPRPGEETLQAAERRLFEEMGFKTSLKKIFNFTYKASFENGLTENEFDYVYVGNYEGEVLPNKNEVNDYCYKNMDDLKSSLAASPTKYTPWLHIAFPKVFTWWRNNLYKQE